MGNTAVSGWGKQLHRRVNPLTLCFKSILHQVIEHNSKNCHWTLKQFEGKGEFNHYWCDVKPWENIYKNHLENKQVPELNLYSSFKAKINVNDKIA